MTALYELVEHLKCSFEWLSFILNLIILAFFFFLRVRFGFKGIENIFVGIKIRDTQGYTKLLLFLVFDDRIGNINIEIEELSILFCLKKMKNKTLNSKINLGITIKMKKKIIKIFAKD